MTTQTPLPFAFARREEFLSLPIEGRTSHLWKAYEFCQNQLGCQRYSDEELQRNLRVIRRMMLEVAKSVSKRLLKDDAWKNLSDERWPRNHRGPDPDHWYDSGAHPPQLLTILLAPSGQSAAFTSSQETLYDEMVTWIETPAGQAGVYDTELQRLLEKHQSSIPVTATPLEATSAVLSEADEDRRRVAGLAWLSTVSANGCLELWAGQLGLTGLSVFAVEGKGKLASAEVQLPKLMELERSGEWEALQQHLDVEAPTDAASLAKLRASLPKRRS
jgi:hypothetical protein